MGPQGFTGSELTIMVETIDLYPHNGTAKTVAIKNVPKGPPGSPAAVKCTRNYHSVTQYASPKVPAPYLTVPMGDAPSDACFTPVSNSVTNVQCNRRAELELSLPHIYTL